jgi:hypothetical protein
VTWAEVTLVAVMLVVVMLAAVKAPLVLVFPSNNKAFLT